MVEVGDGANGSRSVDRALRLLHEVAIAPKGLSLSEAARAVDLPTSTVARILRTLQASGFLSREPEGRYRAGSKLLQIGAVAVGNLAIYNIVEPHLHELSEFTGETAYFAVPEGRDRAVYLRQVESPLAIRHATWTGRAIDTAGTAIGAALSDRVPVVGYVLSRGTAIEPDAAAAAAPIRDRSGAIVGALSIIGPSFRISEDNLSRFGSRVLHHANLVSSELEMIPTGSSHVRTG